MGVAYGQSSETRGQGAETAGKQSAAYLEAMAKGFAGVVYMCDEGKERSEAAYLAALDRKEMHTEKLKDGMRGFVRKYDYDRAKIVDALRRQFSEKYVRVFVDGKSYPPGFLDYLREAGIKFEEMTAGQLKEEAAALGQIILDYYP